MRVRDLSAREESELAGFAVGPGKCGAGLDGVLDDAIVHDIERHDPGRIRERGLYGRSVARLEVAADILRDLVPDERSSGPGGLRSRGGRRERIEIHLEAFRRVA